MYCFDSPIMFYIIQLAEVLRHPWFTANQKDEMELELPMKEVVQVRKLHAKFTSFW